MGQRDRGFIERGEVKKMSTAKINKAEVTRLRARVKELERILLNAQTGWMEDWPKNAIFIGRVETDAVACARVDTARRLRHAVNVKQSEDGKDLLLFADALIPKQD